MRIIQRHGSPEIIMRERQTDMGMVLVEICMGFMIRTRDGREAWLW